MAGIAAGTNGTLQGVAPGASIIAIQVGSRLTGSACGDAGSPCVVIHDSDALAALDYVADTLADGWNVAAVNMSFGSSTTGAASRAATQPTARTRRRWTVSRRSASRRSPPPATRVLKPGAHFCDSDIVLKGQLSAGLKKSAEMYAGCVAGALQQNEYLSIIKETGFTNVEIKKTKVIELPDDVLKQYLGDLEVEKFKMNNVGIFNITVVGYK